MAQEKQKIALHIPDSGFHSAAAHHDEGVIVIIPGNQQPAIPLFVQHRRIGIAGRRQKTTSTATHAQRL